MVAAVLSGSSTEEVEVWDGAGPFIDIALEVDGAGSCIGNSGYIHSNG